MSLRLAVLFTTLTYLLCDAQQPVVRTPYGPVAGRRLTYGGKQIDGFFGIPFAIPPLGQLRFRKPLPSRSWKNVRDATRFQPACMQTNNPLNRDVMLNYSTSASEDCLHINVWRPSCVLSESCQSKSALLPVVLYIYGGAFQWGDASGFYNDGLVFSSVNEVVFVSFNYRTNVFGFLNGRSPDAPGNLAFWDQLLAMQWVQRSISCFGGDPELVTLYGQSSGAMSVGLHVLSPLSKGLFKRCIFESGTALSLLTFQRQFEVSFFSNLAGKLNCTDSTGNTTVMLDCMRRVGAHELIAQVADLGQLSSMFFPVKGDAFFPEYPINFGNVGCVNGEEMLMGTTTDEGSVFFYHPIQRLGDLVEYMTEYYDGATATVISTAFSIPFSAVRHYITSYISNSVRNRSRDEVLNVLSHTYGDPVFVCSTNLWGEALAERGHSVYRYVYGKRMPLSLWDDWMGVVHTEDLPYMLGSVATLADNLREKRWEYLPEWFRRYNATPVELTFSMNLVKSLGAFVKTGKPKIPLSGAEWPKYTAENPEFVYLQPNNYTRGRGPKKDRCEYWRPFLLKQREGGANEEPAPKAITASTESSVSTKQNKATAVRGTLHGIDVPSHHSSSSYTPEPTAVLLTFIIFVIWICVG